MFFDLQIAVETFKSVDLEFKYRVHSLTLKGSTFGHFVSFAKIKDNSFKELITYFFLENKNF